MAKFNAKGIEGLELSMQEFAAIPDAVVEEMLDAAGKVVVRYHRSEISAQGLTKSGKLWRSHTNWRPVTTGSRRPPLRQPTGKNGPPPDR